MRSLHRVLLPLAAAALLAGSGCLSPILLAPSSEPVSGRSFEVVGETSGESCMQSILGIPFATDASLKTALAAARGRIQADNLIEVVVDRYALLTGFYNKTCTVVHARGIRYTDAAAPFLQPGPARPPVPPPVKPTVEEVPAEAPAAAVPAEKKAEPKQPKKLTRAERRRLAAEERKRKAEEKRQAKAEARRKAAEEKRLAAEAEAKAKATAEEKRRAEEDAKLKAEVEARKKAEAEAQRKAEEAARKKAAEAAKPVPKEFDIYCKYAQGQLISVETKAEKIEAAFLGCIHKGMRVKRADRDEELIPFGVIWSVRMAAPPPAAVPAQPRQ